MAMNLSKKFSRMVKEESAKVAAKTSSKAAPHKRMSASEAKRKTAKK